MSDVLPVPGAPYHRLARAPSPRRLRPILGVAAVFAFISVLLTVAVVGAYAIHDPALDRAGSSAAFDQLWEFGTWLIAIGVAAPATLLVARWVDRRPPGSVSSVAGRVRWRWLGRCMLVAGGVFTIYGCLSFLIEPPVEQAAGIDWELVAGVAVVGGALLPLQVAGEEYLFRGYLAQAAGAYLSNPVVPAVVLSLLFGLAHGTEQGWWLFVDRVGFGLVAAWLTIRTGGLEAPIALHFVGNFLGYIGIALDGEFEDALVGPEIAATPVEVTVSLAATASVAFLLSRVARRDRIQTTWSQTLESPRPDS